MTARPGRSSEAEVKKIDPQKKVTPIQSAVDPSAASAGTRNRIEPIANSVPTHQAGRSGRHQPLKAHPRPVSPARAERRG